MLPYQEQTKSFFEQLQNLSGIDLRDRRGLKHELGLVLLEVSLAILCNRDGNLSSIHRHMKHHHVQLLKFLNREVVAVVSRSQLPIILEKVNIKVFEGLLFSHYGVILSDQSRTWFAIDGKEMKSSIALGSKRGEAVVQAVSHQNRIVQSQAYYSGHKDSEVGVVRTLLQEANLLGQKLSMDALHCKPATIEAIAQATGTYLVG